MQDNNIISKHEELLLCSFEDNFDAIGAPDYLSALLDCNWANITQYQQYFSSHLEVNECFLKNNEKQQKILYTAISCLLAYCQENITGPDLKECYIQLPEGVDARNLLTSDSEDINVLINYPEYLLVAERILTALSTVENITPIVHWWLLRCLIIHQQSLEENSQTLYTKIQECIKTLDQFRKQLSDSTNAKDKKYAIMLNLEICQIYLHYKRVNKSEEYLKYAKELADIELDISGALGKRTQYQQKEVAQLTLHIKLNEKSILNENSKLTHSVEAPKLLKLNDDLRLEQIEYTEEQKIEELSCLAQAIVLCALSCHKIAQPIDEIAGEELKSYISVLLKQNYCPWQVRINTLLSLLDLEKTNKRTVERCMCQCEELVTLQKGLNTPVRTRLSYLFLSGPVMRWRTRQVQADLTLSLGLVKTSLDVYLELQLWEDVILCYTLLEMKHKAAEIIRERIAVEPTVKLYCLLGDTTDDIECYKKAWEMSKERSGKAQRHWGNNLYCKSKYEEAIPHFEKSLEINSLQESVWLRLGYAALKIENWELAANAYRHYTNLEQHGFEAWNNLAKAYIKLGMKDRAHKILTEALKCNYDNWQVWENMLVISVDTHNFSDAIRSYDRLLDLRGKHLDLEILEILTKVIINQKPDSQGQNSNRLSDKFQKLMGRISTVHQNEYKVWLIYAMLPLRPILVCPKLLKAFRCLTLNNWTADPKICEEVMKICLDMSELVLDLDSKSEDFGTTEKNELKGQLSSVRLSCKSAYSAIQTARMDCPNAEKMLPKLGEYIEELTKRVTALVS